MKRTIAMAVGLAALSSAAMLSEASAREITVASILNANDVAVQAMKKWDELLQERSGGELSLNILPGGTLGGTRELFQQLSSGEIDVNLSSPVVVREAAPTYQCLEAEYTFRDEAHGFNVWRGEIGKEVSEKMKASYGIEIAGVGRRGSRNLTSNVKVVEPSDLKGVKIRVTNKLRSEVFQAYGAQPAPLALSELYGALRQGVFDAQENPLSTIYSLRFQEVQKYISDTQHIWTYTITYVNSDFHDSLGENKAVFDETLAEAMAWLDDAVAKEEQRIRADIEQGGEAEFVHVDRKAFAEQARPIVAAFAKENCAPGLLDRVDAVPSN